ncbi:hypothetical protein CHISP_3661 [Chitinispirillum alkaliphilum]|nr:hypothetical protein CHISP_3661 [Chitinispirillum alkaliphilum]
MDKNNSRTVLIKISLPFNYGPTNSSEVMKRAAERIDYVFTHPGTLEFALLGLYKYRSPIPRCYD